jgi:hypothetical protein
MHKAPSPVEVEIILKVPYYPYMLKKFHWSFTFHCIHGYCVNPHPSQSVECFHKV